MAFFTLYHLTNWLYLQKPQLSNLGETRCWLILVNNSLCSIPLYTRLYKITPGDRCGGEPAWPRHATLDSSHFLPGCLTWHGHAASWTIGGPRMYGRLLVRCWMTVFCLNCMTVMKSWCITQIHDWPHYSYRGQLLAIHKQAWFCLHQRVSRVLGGQGY